METLFTTELILNGNSQIFTVSFHEDRYIFQTLNSSTQFSIRREEDEWHMVESVDNQLKDLAIEKLEAYLLSQH